MAEVKIAADSGGGSVALKGPASTTSNAAVSLKLPVADGSANQLLKTDGSGNLGWATDVGGEVVKIAEGQQTTAIASISSDALDMSVSATVNLLNPPPVPETPTFTLTLECTLLNSSATASETG